VSHPSDGRDEGWAHCRQAGVKLSSLHMDPASRRRHHYLDIFSNTMSSIKKPPCVPGESGTSSSSARIGAGTAGSFGAWPIGIWYPSHHAVYTPELSSTTIVSSCQVRGAYVRGYTRTAAPSEKRNAPWAFVPKR